MARYAEWNKFIGNLKTDKYGNTTVNEVGIAFEKAAANVVPKSEVDWNSIPVDVSEALKQRAVEKAKAEVVREIFEEIYKSVASKIPMKIRPIFKDDRDFDAGVIDGKRDALIEVLSLIAELEKKYIGEIE